MRIAMHVCPTKFLYARRKLAGSSALRILDIGCGNQSPTTTKHWFPNCHYAGADIQRYNLTDADMAAMDEFFLLSTDGSGYDAIPGASFDFILLHHVVEHMRDPVPPLAAICSKLKPGGVIWIAFPSLRSLGLPSAEGTLQFCDDETHVRLPDTREVTNILLANQVKVLHAGRTRDTVRTLIGVVMLPVAWVRKMLTGRLSCKGLWYVLGFEDHVFGQRRA